MDYTNQSIRIESSADEMGALVLAVVKGLQAAARHFGLEWDGKEHNAVADCQMTLAVLKKMAEYQPEASKETKLPF